MKTTSMLLSALAAGMLAMPAANAEPSSPGFADNSINNGPMRGAMAPPPRMRMRPPAKPKFPTPQELARMAPAEPLTEKTIQERFAERRKHLKAMLEDDRKAAQKYAQDFARYQKQQADSLSKIMARAEERRKAILKHLEEREAQVLERFRQNRQNQKSDGNNTTTAQ